MGIFEDSKFFEFEKEFRMSRSSINFVNCLNVSLVLWRKIEKGF